MDASMPQTVAQLLPGQIAFAMLAAAVLAYPLARGLLWRYERAVEAAMRASSPARNAGVTAAAPLPAAPLGAPRAQREAVMLDETVQWLERRLRAHPADLQLARVLYYLRLPRMP